MITNFKLFENGYDNFQYDKEWIEAVENTDYDKVEYLLVLGYDPDRELIFSYSDEDNDTGETETALQYCSFMKKIDICELLIKYNADVNIKDNSNNTILMKSVFTRYDERLFDLILNNIDSKLIMNRNNLNRTLFDYIGISEKNKIFTKYPYIKRLYLTDQRKQKFNL